MEKHGKLSQNDVDEADTAVVYDKREIMIWIFGLSQIAAVSASSTSFWDNFPFFSIHSWGMAKNC